MIDKYRVGSYTIPNLRIGGLSLRVPVGVMDERPFPKDKLIVGFMGSAGKESDIRGHVFEPGSEHKERGEMIGEIIARSGAILSNGGVWGVPYYPIRGAYRSGGFTMAISPYPDEKSHIAKNPIKHLNLIIYVGVKSPINPGFEFVFRDSINTLYPDVVVSDGGRWGSLDEDVHVLEQGGIFVPVRGSGGATDILIDIIESKKIKKDMGAKVIIPKDTSQQSLESAILIAIEEAHKRWGEEDRKENRFADVAYMIEREMKWYRRWPILREITSPFL